jgi:hypothetical protein
MGISKNFNVTIFSVVTFIIGLLTLVTFVFAAAVDEGTSNLNPISLLIADLYFLFRFPTHTLFEKLFLNNAGAFFVGLFINCLFYGFLIERVVAIIKLKNIKA